MPVRMAMSRTIGSTAILLRAGTVMRSLASFVIRDRSSGHCFSDISDRLTDNFASKASGVAFGFLKCSLNNWVF